MCFPGRESGTPVIIIFPECLVLLGRIVFTGVVSMVEVCIIIHITAVCVCGTNTAQLCMTALLSYNRETLHPTYSSGSLQVEVLI